MAKVMDIDEAALAEWLLGRPQIIQEMARSHPPDRLYRMTSTGQRVTLCSYSEDGTARVSVSGEYNLLSMERGVFGVAIGDLIECDLPSDGEPVGAILTNEEVKSAVATGDSRDERMEAVRCAAMLKLGIAP